MSYQRMHAILLSLLSFKEHERAEAMSLHYLVSPLRANEKFAHWLHDFGIVLPSSTESRFPTLREIYFVLEHLEDCTFDSANDYFTGGTHWEADIIKRDCFDDQGVGEWANLCVMNYQGNDDTPLAFYFRKGFVRLMILIVQRLTEICGPLVIVQNSGYIPLLVTPETDIDQVVQTWDI